MVDHVTMQINSLAENVRMLGETIIDYRVVKKMLHVLPWRYSWITISMRPRSLMFGFLVAMYRTTVLSVPLLVMLMARLACVVCLSLISTSQICVYTVM